ncbi:hypothetical protein [Rhizobium binae]|uniref:hypothetical protein n=1 Tax=Rhizobium binae TaxID=1138190 RepID=UPI001FEF02B9|nr:hypothetical protein [Rhizobium binae]
MSAWTCLIHHMLMDLGLPSSFAAANGTTYQKIAEYYRLKHGSLSQLVDWMKREWQISPAQLKNSELHRLIVELDFPLVYTTIYDSNLEMSYETFGRPIGRRRFEMGGIGFEFLLLEWSCMALSRRSPALTSAAS